MEFSKEQKQGVERQFDSYCHKILHLKACKCFADLTRKAKCEKSVEDLSVAEIKGLSANDVYPSFYTLFHIPEYEMSIAVKNEKIAKAITALTPDKRDVVLLYYFGDLRDWEIAELLHLVRRTVAYRRLTALESMKSILERLDGTQV